MNRAYPEFPRTFYVSLFISGVLAVVNGRATFKALRKMRILNTAFCLGVAPTGAGNTTVVVKKNAVAIGGATDLQLAAAAANVSKAPSVGVVGEPAGVNVEVGDLITVDVTAICATTPGTDGRVDLLCCAVEA